MRSKGSMLNPKYCAPTRPRRTAEVDEKMSASNSCLSGTAWETLIIRVPEFGLSTTFVTIPGGSIKSPIVSKRHNGKKWKGWWMDGESCAIVLVNLASNHAESSAVEAFVGLGASGNKL
jgi:hypothetical protein